MRSKIAVFDLGALKAPGPDGFSGIFYQTYWEIINSVIHHTTSHSLETATFLPAMNRTFLTLIPKQPSPKTAAHFRPIGLCNFSYKILAKVLANRLKPLMPSLISENQSAFVSGRQI